MKRPLIVLIFTNILFVNHLMAQTGSSLSGDENSAVVEKGTSRPAWSCSISFRPSCLRSPLDNLLRDKAVLDGVPTFFRADGAGQEESRVNVLKACELAAGNYAQGCETSKMTCIGESKTIVTEPCKSPAILSRRCGFKDSHQVEVYVQMNKEMYQDDYGVAIEAKISTQNGLKCVDIIQH